MFRLAVVMAFMFLFSVNTAQAARGTLTGKLLLKHGGPMVAGQVVLFNADFEPIPDFRKYWRVPDAAVDTDEKGAFTVQLEAGRYYLGAVKRKSGEKTGPVQEGDYFLPTHDKTNKYRVVTIKAGVTTKAGTIRGIEHFKRQTVSGTKEQAVASIEGKVVNTDGKPVARAMVVAYLEPVMQGPPLLASERTKEDGMFTLKLHKGGTYYLKARGVYGGGVPDEGEFMGRFGGDEQPTPVEAADGAVVKDITIVVQKFTRRR